MSQIRATLPTLAWDSEGIIYILGSGSFAHELVEYLREMYGDNSLKILLVADHPPADLKVTEYWERIDKPGFAWSIMGSGQAYIKRKMAKEIRGICPRVIIDAWVAKTASIGAGSVIAPNAVIAPHVEIKEHVLVNYGATIGHDTIVHDYSVVSPNASVGGTCRLFEGSYIGAGAMVRENLVIGENATVGMGAVVVKNVEPNTTVVGVPAKPVK